LYLAREFDFWSDNGAITQDLVNGEALSKMHRAQVFLSQACRWSIHLEASYSTCPKEKTKWDHNPTLDIQELQQRIQMSYLFKSVQPIQGEMGIADMLKELRDH